MEGSVKTKDELIAELEQRIGRPVTEEEIAGAWAVYRDSFADVFRGFAEAVRAWIAPITRLANSLDRWYRMDHPETIKAAGANPRARHKRRYQRMMARKGV